MNPQIRVILVEPQALFLAGARDELERTEDIDVVGTGTTGAEAVEMIRELQPDVAIVAMNTPKMTGLDVLRSVNDHNSETAARVIILSSDNADTTIYQAMVAKARGYLLKWEVEDLATSIRAAHAGRILLGGEALTNFINAVIRQALEGTPPDRRKKDQRLSDREREILTYIGQGRRVNEIAELLALSPTTVRTHCRNTYLKLGVKTQAAAVREATRRQLI